MKKISQNNLINIVIIMFFIIQPIFDIKYFYNSISTLIRVIIIFMAFLYYFFICKNKNKYYLLIYPGLIAIYFIFHHINATRFTSLVPGNFNYSILKEALYFVKMLSPFMLIYALYNAHISDKTITDIMKYLVIIISSIIIITNLLGISYGSYSDIRIKANFFEWFNKNNTYTYQDLASKGIFEYANQISSILIMFLPFILYNAINNHNFINYAILFLNIFALILLCTKVSVLGIFVVFVYILFTYGVISFIQNRTIPISTLIKKISKQYIPILVLFLIYCIVLPFNPMYDRIHERVALSENVEVIFENNVANTNTEIYENNDEIFLEAKNNIDTSEQSIYEANSFDTKIQYIEANYKDKQLHEEFLFDNYPYRYDPDFWYNFLQNDLSHTTNYRFVELSIIKRVVEINNNPLDKLFGITNTRLQNIFNIERDFVVQYYALRHNWINSSVYTILYNFRKIHI